MKDADRTCVETRENVEMGKEEGKEQAKHKVNKKKREENSVIHSEPLKLLIRSYNAQKQNETQKK